MKLKLNNDEILSIIQIHAPTSSHSDEEIEIFYCKLHEIINELKTDLLFVIGDFNCKIGTRSKEEKSLVGPYGLGNRNSRGHRMLLFALEHSLKITNTYFQKRPNRRWTWSSPNGETHNEIDYILTGDIKRVLDTGVLSNFKFHSDHRLLRCKIMLNRSCTNRRNRRILNTKKS